MNNKNEQNYNEFIEHLASYIYDGDVNSDELFKIFNPIQARISDLLIKAIEEQNDFKNILLEGSIPYEDVLGDAVMEFAKIRNHGVEITDDELISLTIDFMKICVEQIRSSKYQGPDPLYEYISDAMHEDLKEAEDFVNCTTELEELVSNTMESVIGSDQDYDPEDLGEIIDDISESYLSEFDRILRSYDIVMDKQMLFAFGIYYIADATYEAISTLNDLDDNIEEFDGYDEFDLIFNDLHDDEYYNVIIKKIIKQTNKVMDFDKDTRISLNSFYYFAPYIKELARTGNYAKIEERLVHDLEESMGLPAMLSMRVFDATILYLIKSHNSDFEYLLKDVNMPLDEVVLTVVRNVFKIDIDKEWYELEYEDIILMMDKIRDLTGNNLVRVYFKILQTILSETR